MYRKIAELLRPYSREYRLFLAGVILRQASVMVGGYSLVWALRTCLDPRALPEWTLVAAFIAYDALSLRFDLSLNYFFSERVSYPLFAQLRLKALEKVLRMPLEWHQRQSSGELAGEVNNGVGKVVQTTEGVSRELLPALIQTLFSLAPLFYFAPRTTPILLAALALFLWLALLENRRRRPHARRRYRNYNRDFGLFAETVEAIQPVVQYGQEGQVLGRYRRVQERIVEQGLLEARIGNRFGVRRQLVVTVAKRVCQGVWIWQYRHNTLDVATIFYLNMLTEQLVASFAGYASLLERIYDGLEPARLLVRLLDERPSIADAPAVRRVRVSQAPGVCFDGVRFAYPSRSRSVLRDFRLAIAPGTVLGIVGRSGSGKTTIQNLLTRLFDVQEGRVEVAGLDVRRWPLVDLRSLFAHVSQYGGVFFSGLRIADTIRFTRPDATLREVVEAAKAACIHEDICRMPEKYRTRVGQGGASFSKGQQQRIALAQALLALGDGRRIVILDEFTSALDSETEERILRNLQPWLEGRTVIIVAHRLSTVRKLADEIVVLDASGIAEQGSHAELIERDGWYAEMARMQSVGAEEFLRV